MEDVHAFLELSTEDRPAWDDGSDKMQRAKVHISAYLCLVCTWTIHSKWSLVTFRRENTSIPMKLFSIFVYFVWSFVKHVKVSSILFLFRYNKIIRHFVYETTVVFCVKPTSSHTLAKVQINTMHVHFLVRIKPVLLYCGQTFPHAYSIVQIICFEVSFPSSPLIVYSAICKAILDWWDTNWWK